MANYLLATNRLSSPHWEKAFSVSEYHFYCNRKGLQEFEDISVYIHGYVIPRYSVFEDNSSFSQQELVRHLYSEYKDEFIHRIKGVFTVFIIFENQILVYTDQLGIQKCFISHSKEQLILSDSFKEVNLNLENLSIDFDNVAENSLFHHYLEGTTFAKNVKYLPPANCLILGHGDLVQKHYWQVKQLLEIEKTNASFEEFAEVLKSLINQYLDYLKPDNVTMSLTGGKDCRTILAGLLNLGIKPYAFTYGNPNSRDAHYAKLIAEGENLKYDVFHTDYNESWYHKTYEDLIGLNNPLINVHRAHRLHSFSTLKNQLSGTTLFFGGYMGGEILMGLHYDDLIMTSLLRKNWEDQIPLETLVKESFTYNFIKEEAVHTNEILEKISSSQLFGEDKKLLKHFKAIFEIGVLHHSQDVNLAMHEIDYPVPFFLDIDLLEMLFASKFNLLHHNNQSKNPFDRFKLFEFNINVQHLLYSALDTYHFGKKGFFNPGEFLGNKIYLASLRAYRNYFNKKAFPPSFTYGKDFHKFIYHELGRIQKEKKPDIDQIFNVSAAMDVLRKDSIGSQEKYLHRFTNIVMLDRFINYYKV